MEKVIIRNRFTDAVIFEYTPTEDQQASGLAMRHAAEAAVSSGASLYGANLYGANLTGANLDGANLYGANLDGANLYGASLDGANLYGASLDGASLYGASLDGASLTGANLDGANLTHANLTRANLDGANLDGANLDGANLYGASLTGASLTGASLIGDRPIFQVGPVGSRCAYFVSFITDQGVMLRAGCFFGSVDAFRSKLTEEHAGTDHEKEYLAALALIEVHASIWGNRKELLYSR